VAALEAGISKLDKEVAEATEQRQAENQEYKALVASDTATKELLVFAKNRLNKFYNPKLYKPPAKAELSSEGRIVESFKLVQISQHVGSEAAPPPAPETADYSKKGEESTGVIAMIDLLIADMDKEMTEAGAEEKDAQADYEAMIEDSKAKRSADSKSIAEKNGVKADMEAELEAQKGVKKDAGSQLFATLKFIDSRCAASRAPELTRPSTVSSVTLFRSKFKCFNPETLEKIEHLLGISLSSSAGHQCASAGWLCRRSG